MNKQNKLRTGIFAFALMLLCNPLVFAQSGKESGTGTPMGTAVQKSQKMTAVEELRNFQRTNPDMQPGDMRYRLLKAKAVLETGIADKSLNEQQIAELKNNIAGYEARMPKTKPGGNQVDLSKPVYTNNSARTAPERATPERINSERAVLTSKQFTRQQFLALTEQEQRNLLRNTKNLNITDLINATEADFNNRTSDTYIITEDNFRNSEIMKQIYVLKHSGSYLIVKNGTIMPKTRISKTDFNSFPAERQKAIIESNQYEITN